MSKLKGSLVFLIFAICLNLVSVDKRLSYLLFVMVGMVFGFGIKKWFCHLDNEDGEKDEEN